MIFHEGFIIKLFLKSIYGIGGIGEIIIAGKTYCFGIINIIKQITNIEIIIIISVFVRLK